MSIKAVSSLAFVLAAVGPSGPPQAVTAIPTKALSIQELVGSADVVVIGEALSDVGEGLVTTAMPGMSAPLTFRVMTASLQVRQYLQPASGPSVLAFRHYVVEEGIHSLEYHRVPIAAPRMYFLKSRGATYEAVDHAFPGVEVAPGFITSGTTLDERVARALGSVLQWRDAPLNAIHGAVFALASFPSAPSRLELQRVVSHVDRGVQLQALSALIRMGDVAVAPQAVRALMDDQPDGPDDLEELRGVVMAHLRAIEAIPQVAQLLRAPDVRTRRAAVTALRFMRSPQVVPALVLALEIDDEEVQYQAVEGLADVVGEPELTVARERFAGQRQALVARWRVWAAERGYGR